MEKLFSSCSFNISPFKTVFTWILCMRIEHLVEDLWKRFPNKSEIFSLLIKILRFENSRYAAYSINDFEENSFLSEKSSFMCGLKMMEARWRKSNGMSEKGRETFHHSTTGKTLSNQERLNMIKISSPSPHFPFHPFSRLSPCVLGGRKNFFHLREPRKSSTHKLAETLSSDEGKSFNEDER